MAPVFFIAHPVFLEPVLLYLDWSISSVCEVDLICVRSMLSTRRDRIQPAYIPVRARGKRIVFRVMGTHCLVQFEVHPALIYT